MIPVGAKEEIGQELGFQETGAAGAGIVQEQREDSLQIDVMDVEAGLPEAGENRKTSELLLDALDEDEEDNKDGSEPERKPPGSREHSALDKAEDDLYRAALDSERSPGYMSIRNAGRAGEGNSKPCRFSKKSVESGTAYEAETSGDGRFSLELRNTDAAVSSTANYSSAGALPEPGSPVDSAYASRVIDSAESGVYKEAKKSVIEASNYLSGGAGPADGHACAGCAVNNIYSLMYQSIQS